MHVTVIVICVCIKMARIKIFCLIPAFIEKCTELFVPDCLCFLALQCSPNLTHCLVVVDDSIVVVSFDILKIPINAS
jgi:hypothetical protein